MANINALLNERLKKNGQSSKMAAMAKQSAGGNLTSFAGVFNVAELNDQEKANIEELLHHYVSGKHDITSDLSTLLSLTSEVKSISNQAAILHGERIKKAQEILKTYRDGAFTAWLMTAYGNRQTPYNFLHYYEFCQSLPKALKLKLDLMPRQAVYTLATREAPLVKKQLIVENYKSQTKTELLREIREAFPLAAKDRRRQNIGENVIQELKRIADMLQRAERTISSSQKRVIQDLLNDLSKNIMR